MQEIRVGPAPVMQPSVLPLQHMSTTAEQKITPTRARAYSGLGTTQVILGILLIIFGVVAIIIKCEVYYLGTAIWCGLFIISSMVMSILAASIFACTCLIIASIALATENVRYDCSYDWEGDYNCYNDNTQDARIAIDSVIIALSVLEGIVAIVYASMCCGSVCCRDTRTPAVYYCNNGRQPEHQSQQVPMLIGTTALGMCGLYMLPAGTQLISYGGALLPQESMIAQPGNVYNSQGVVPYEQMQQISAPVAANIQLADPNIQEKSMTDNPELQSSLPRYSDLADHRNCDV
ncbi:uncharacterized protein LOC144360133 [Saccoglossus kowalevskii]